MTQHDELKDVQSQRRDKKKRSQREQIKQHGRNLKKFTDRTASHMAKVEKRKKKK